MPLYKRPDSDIWWLDIRHAGRRVRRSTGEADRAAAQRVHNEVQIQLWQAAPLSAERTWGQAVELWTSVEDRSESELLSLAKFGARYPDRALSAVTAESVNEALSFCKTAGTYTRYRTMIAAILNSAKKAGWVDKVPVLHARKDKKTKRREWLTHDEWADLFLCLPAHLQAPAEFSVSTGLRQANVLELRWAQVDLSRKLVHIEADETKGDKALSVPLSVSAIQALERVAGQHPEFVFTFRGKPIGSVKTAWTRACVKAGLHPFKWHGLRHTWATWHVQNGTPLDVLQKLGGWADLRMVQLYSHHAPNYLASFADNAGRQSASLQHQARSEPAGDEDT